MAYLQSMEFSSAKPKLVFRQLKKMLHAKSNARNKLSSKCVYSSKKTAKQIYIEQIEDTPKNKCGICKRLQFEKNMRSVSKYLQKVDMDLVEKDKTFVLKRICASFKRALENEKLPLFAVPKHIRCNMHLPIVQGLSKLEERLVSIRITFSQIRQCGYK